MKWPSLITKKGKKSALTKRGLAPSVREKYLRKRSSWNVSNKCHQDLFDEAVSLFSLIKWKNLHFQFVGCHCLSNLDPGSLGSQNVIKIFISISFISILVLLWCFVYVIIVLVIVVIVVVAAVVDNTWNSSPIATSILEFAY